MGIEAKCGQCGKQYTVPDSWAGKQVQCPRCPARVEIAFPVVDIVVTGDDVPSPFIDPPEAASPFAQSPAKTDSGPWKVAPQDQLSNTFSKPMAKPGSSFSTKLLQSRALLIATGIGMGLVLLGALVVGLIAHFANRTGIPEEPIAEGLGGQLAEMQPPPPSSAPQTARPRSTPDSLAPPGINGSISDGSNAPESGRAGPPGGHPFGPAAGARGRFPGRPSLDPNMPGPGFRGPPSRGPGFRGPPSRGPGGRGSGGRPDVPKFEASKALLVSRFGAARVVTVLAEPVEGSQFKQFTDSIRTAAHADRPGVAASLSNGMLRVAVGPVNDIQAFAERLDIGKIVNVDRTGLTITVEARSP